MRMNILQSVMSAITTSQGPLVLLMCFCCVSLALADNPVKSDVPDDMSIDVSLAGTERPSISRFLQVRSACSIRDIYTGSSFSLSPDGRQVSFVTDISGKPQLWVVVADGGWPHQLTFGESVTFHRWAPNGKYILYGSDRSGNEQEGYYLITPDGRSEKELLPASNAYRCFGSFTSDGQKAVYATTGRSKNAYDIHMINLDTGEDQEMSHGRMGLGVEGISPDGTRLVLSEQDSEDSNKLYIYDVATKQLTNLFESEQRSRYTNINWRPDGKGLYLTTNQGQDRTGLAYYDIEGSSLRYIEESFHNIELVKLSTDGRYLAWTENQDGYSRLRLRDLDENANLDIPHLPQGTICSLNWAGKVPILGMGITSPRIPGDIWTWDLRNGKVHQRTKSDIAGIDMSRMVVPEIIDFKARDGVRLHGFLYSPPNRKSEVDPPVVLKVHGGPTLQTRPNFDPTIQYLLTRGVAVLDLNYRGSTGYGKKFSRLNDGRLHENELKDIVDAIDYLAKQGLDTTRTGIMGRSYGGYLVMAAMTRLPDLFSCGVSWVPVSDWVTVLEDAPPSLIASDRIEYGDINNAEDREFLKQMSPLTHVKHIKAPILVLHGAKDVRCPVNQSDRFVEAVRQQGGDVEYLRFSDEGHHFKKIENELLAYSRAVSFIEERLGSKK